MALDSQAVGEICILRFTATALQLTAKLCYLDLIESPSR